MTTIPSIDLMAPAAELPIGTLVNRTLENGAAFANAVSVFQQAMASVPEARPAETSAAAENGATLETLKAAFAQNQALGNDLATRRDAASPMLARVLMTANGVANGAMNGVTANGATSLGDAASRRVTADAIASAGIAKLAQSATAVPATPETLKAVLNENAALAATLPEVKSETFADVVARNAALAAALPEVKPTTLPKIVELNSTIAATLPEVKSTTLPKIVEQNAAIAAALPEVKPQVSSEPVKSVAVKIAPATPETLKPVVAETISLMPKDVPATPETLKPVVAETIALMPKVVPATPTQSVASDSRGASVTSEASVARGASVASEASVARGASVASEASVARGAGVASEASVARGAGVASEARVTSETSDSRSARVTSETSVASDTGVAKARVEWRQADTSEVSEVPVLQAAPMAVPVQVVEGAPVTEEVGAVAAVDATRVAAVAAASGSDILLEAANAVVETMMVSPGLMRGEGEIRVMLKPEVLEGTELTIRVAGGTLTVEFMPTVARVAELLVANQPQLVQHLTERIHSFQIAVNVNPRRGSVGKVRI